MFVYEHEKEKEREKGKVKRRERKRMEWQEVTRVGKTLAQSFGLFRSNVGKRERKKKLPATSFSHFRIEKFSCGKERKLVFGKIVASLVTLAMTKLA